MRCARIPPCRARLRRSRPFEGRRSQRHRHCNACANVRAGRRCAALSRVPAGMRLRRGSRVPPRTSASRRSRSCAAECAWSSPRATPFRRRRQILMELVRGPFTRLIGRWRFEPIGERGSRVGFHVEFEFKNRLMAVALNPVFESVCDNIVDAFVVRAREVYGAAPRAAARVARARRGGLRAAARRRPTDATSCPPRRRSAMRCAPRARIRPSWTSTSKARRSESSACPRAASSRSHAGDRVEIYRPLAARSQGRAARAGQQAVP